MWRDEHLVVPRARHAAGQLVEHCRRVRADARICGKQPKVFIQPGSARVVVARADVGVAPDLPCFLADHQRQLDVGLELFHAVGHVHPFALQ